jgi:hypothetical protein
MGQIVLSGALDATHQQEASLRMPKLCIMVEIMAAKPALCWQIDPLLQPPGRAQQLLHMPGDLLGLQPRVFGRRKYLPHVLNKRLQRVRCCLRHGLSPLGFVRCIVIRPESP